MSKCGRSLRPLLQHTTTSLTTGWIAIVTDQTYKRRGRKKLGERQREEERETILSPRYDRVTHAEISHMEGGGREGGGA